MNSNYFTGDPKVALEQEVEYLRKILEETCINIIINNYIDLFNKVPDLEKWYKDNKPETY